MNVELLLRQVVGSIEDAKGQDVNVLDVRQMTDVTDYMVIVTGTSSRHVRTITKSVVSALRDAGCRPLGVEGERHAQWVLLDFTDVLVHVMVAEAREFYDLESHWRPSLKAAEASVSAGAAE